MSSKKKAPVYGKYFCPGCGGHYHNIDPEKFDPKKQPNGTWFSLRKKYGPKGAHWDSFPNNDPAIMDHDLVCPNCNSVYMDIASRTTWVYDDEEE